MKITFLPGISVRRMDVARLCVAFQVFLQGFHPGKQLPERHPDHVREGGMVQVDGIRGTVRLCARQELTIAVRSRWTQLFAGAFAALAPGGRVVVSDFLLAEDRTSPRQAAPGPSRPRPPRPRGLPGSALRDPRSGRTAPSR